MPLPGLGKLAAGALVLGAGTLGFQEGVRQKLADWLAPEHGVQSTSRPWNFNWD